MTDEPTAPPRSGRPPHPHARVGRDRLGGADPRSRRGRGLPRRHRRSPTTTGSTPPWRPGRWRRTGACASAVVVGEEISTRGGHLVGLFLERPVPALRSLAWSIEAVHDQGGLAIPAHPLVPYPLCAQGSALRRLLGGDNAAARPDAIETFNPTALGKYRHDAVVRFAEEHGLAEFGSSDAHAARGDRHLLDDVPRTDPGRRARGARRAHHATPRRLPRLARAAGRLWQAAGQVRAGLARHRRRAGPARRDGPGPRLPGRHPAAGRATTRLPAARTAREDRPRLPVRVPAAGRRHPARPVPVREPPPARPRGPDPHVLPRPAAAAPRAT